MIYVSLDCEMGGIDPEYSLLTTYIGAYNEAFELLDDLYLYTKPNDGRYVLSAGGMAVNRINIVEHDRNAITYKEARSKLGSFLRMNYERNGNKRMTCLGHNVTTDLRVIWGNIYPREKWETYVSYRVEDTSPVCQFLLRRGILPYNAQGKEGVSGSLESLAKYLGIPVDDSKLHDAKYDTQLTVEVAKALGELDLSVKAADRE